MSNVRRPRADRSKVQECQGDLLATNTGVRLACTMAAMLSPFAVFLCWAERESRAIRRFAVQSAALLALHAVIGCILLAVGLVCSGIPYLNFLVSLVCWLLYVAAVLVILYLRVRLMERAWHGLRCELPLLERLIRKYY